MPKLTKEQEQAVRQWAEGGANLNEVQDRLKTEHDITLTYLDARLLIGELGLKLQEKKKEPPPEEKKPVPQEAEPPMEDDDFDAAEEAEVIPPPAGAGKASVTVDQIAIPGMAASGKVTFSDGKTAAWYLDQMGRLGMKAPEPGYTPPAADIPVFQRELDLALQRAGL